MSDSVSAPVDVEERKIERSDGEGVPGKSTGGSNGARALVRCVERLIKDWAFGSMAVWAIMSIKLLLTYDTDNSQVSQQPTSASLCVHSEVYPFRLRNRRRH
jgi:hypothetical protein